MRRNIPTAQLWALIVGVLVGVFVESETVVGVAVTGTFAQWGLSAPLARALSAGVFVGAGVALAQAIASRVRS